ncbi:hypothetical protein OJAV_G00113550 [Oryzias javanicus]|uniref:TNFR-Cys domain-containing protein n=1 Tax=Oryzias javanicus TaxID=123683 RepID=A0A3S2P5E0_ORYJA|nr:hypothetical protein OJAV_G00113550 [Oryzias javanicus]
MVFAVLLLLLVALVHTIDNPLTYERRDFVTGKPVKCTGCQPGSYLRAHCTTTQSSQCAPCPRGTFTELWNYIGKCLRCGVCGINQVVKKQCTAFSDCQCECKEGFFLNPNYNMCTRHSECPSGQGVLTEDGAENLNHHEMTIKKKRRLVHKLLSESGEKDSGTSQMNFSQLQRTIEEWIPSSTPNQVHKLIEIMSKVGAESNAEKLKSKLNRIKNF